jgi:hypothetical protein
MLAFTVMHDSVITLVEKNEHTSVSHYADTNTASQESSDDMQEVHSMFHFVGLIIPYKNTFVQLQKEKTLSHNLLQYTFPQQETSYKPPIT